jgi:hypothetical protein
MADIINFERLIQFFGNPAIVIDLLLISNALIGYRFKSWGTAIAIVLGIIAYYAEYNMIGASIVILAVIILNLATRLTRRLGVIRTTRG